MTLDKFLFSLGLQKPLIAVRGDILNTPADHIAFAVHYKGENGYLNNNNGGFSSTVAEYGWEDIGSIQFERGVPVTRKIKGKYFHALPVHSSEHNGWKDAPELIQECLNKLPVDSTEVIACVLMGGGQSGEKYGATVRNLEGMVKTYKTVVLYVYDDILYKLLLGTGVVAHGLPTQTSLLDVPKVRKYRDRPLEELFLEFSTEM